MSEVKFPFKPNKTVAAAFQHESTLRNTAKLLIDTLLESVIEQSIDPWEIVKREHPELAKYLQLEGELSLAYNPGIREFTLKKQPK